jgi:hypothetical protein
VQRFGDFLIEQAVRDRHELHRRAQHWRAWRSSGP